MTTTPGKTPPYDNMMGRVVFEALHAIAPGRELELAEALPEVFELLREVSYPYMDNEAEYGDWLQRRDALLSKLGLDNSENSK